MFNVIFVFSLMEALIGSLFAGVGSSVVNAAISSSQSSTDFARSKKLMEYQDQLQSERWSQQFNDITSYNHPANELSRLKEAGINPLHDSQYGGQTGITPSADVSASQFHSQPIDLSGIGKSFDTLIQGILTEKSLSLDERRVKALEQKTGSDIENQTNMTNSEVAVNTQKIENLIKEGNLTDSQKAKVDVDLKAVTESVNQRWLEVKANLSQLALNWNKYSLDKYNTGVQNEIARYNAGTDRMNAVTAQNNLQLANQQFEFNKEKWVKEFKLNSRKVASEINRANFDTCMKVLKDQQITILGSRFGFGGFDKMDIRKMSDVVANMGLIMDNIDKFTPLQKCQILPKVSKNLNLLDSVKLDVPKLNDSWSNPYFPKDASDAF